MELDISFGKHRADTNWKPEFLSWGEFVDKLSKVRRTNETKAQYDAMDKTKKGQTKDGPAFVGGLVRGGRRKKENLDTRSLITLGADNVADDFLFSVELVLGGTAYLLYSTHSHRPDKPRYRLIVLPDRSMSPDEYSAASRKLAEQIGMDYFDKTTFEVHRLMYLPSCSADAEMMFQVCEGDPQSVDGLLAEYQDWTDVTQWPRHPKDKNGPQLAARKAQDPREKNGVIGLLCRAYSIEEGIETFLSDVYVPGTIPNRYTYQNGTSGNGLEIYADQELVYSHQDSDPIADGRTYNLFDLIRVHKFGHLDENVKPFTPDAKKPSHMAMERWAADRPEIKKLVIAERQADFAEMGADMESDEVDQPDWTDKLENHHKTGLPLPTAENIELILSNGIWRGVLAYDAFAHSEVICKPLPWRGRERADQLYEPWLAEDDARRDHWFDKTYKIKSAVSIRNAFTEVIRKNKVHPIKQFLESTPWDGTERLDLLFHHYLGCADGMYEREVTRKILIAACKRIYQPGCKFDEMLVLVGPQGSHKSSLLARLGGKWFSDSIKNLENKEAGEQLQKAWIVELSELSAIRKSEREEIKAFLSKTEDRYRVAYDRVVTEFPRKCVFFGTTNTFDFLKDPTGDRRFWPVVVDPSARKFSHFEHLTDEVLRQIWAEALLYYRKGESIRLSQEAEAIAQQKQLLHTEMDPRIGQIEEYLETAITKDWYQKETWERRNYYDMPTGDLRRDRVSAIEIWTECLKESGKIPHWEARAISAIMSRMPGWEPYCNNRGQAKIPGYGLQKIFVRTQQ